MNGKARCAQLKKIRQEIARRNDIHLEIKACDYEGDCAGTCPACEAEVRYLEDALERRRAAGLPIELKDICLSDICAFMRLSPDEAARLSEPLDDEDQTEKITMGRIEVIQPLNSGLLGGLGEGTTPKFF